MTVQLSMAPTSNRHKWRQTDFQQSKTFSLGLHNLNVHKNWKITARIFIYNMVAFFEHFFLLFSMYEYIKESVIGICITYGRKTNNLIVNVLVIWFWF